MENDCPRLLIISHNILEETNNVGKTLLSFLTKWPSEKLNSIYFRTEKPVTCNCNSYYQIDDKSVFYSLFKKNMECGKIFHKEDIEKTFHASEIDKMGYRFGNKRIPLVSYIRDKVWIKGTWKNNQFVRWLKAVDPEVIFFVPNDYELAFYVLRFVKAIVDVPVITYYTDDAFYFNQKCTGIDAIRRRRLRKLGAYACEKSSYIFTTCKKMSQEYSKYYKVTCEKIGNSIDKYDKERKKYLKKENNELRISYIGNLHSNRWKNVLDVGDTIAGLRRQGKRIMLYIFSASDLPVPIMKKINSCDGICWKGKIDNKHVRQEQLKADILLHVEAFDEKSKKSTRLSISTKIFEYLYSGKIILGYGPADVASMEYLEELKYSILCNRKDNLGECILRICDQYNELSATAQESTQYAIEHFDKSVVSQYFYDVVCDVYRKEGKK